MHGQQNVKVCTCCGLYSTRLLMMDM